MRGGRALLRVVSAAFLAGVLAAGIAAPAQAVPTVMEKRLIARINDAREAHGVRQLKAGPRLQRAAHRWAAYLRRQDAFRHGRLGRGTSEVIAWGAPCSWMTPFRAVRLWLNSPPHRHALLDRTARYVGTGWAAGSWRSFRCAEMAVARFR
jgi:uncharacterized protein YkwD